MRYFLKENPTIQHQKAVFRKKEIIFLLVIIASQCKDFELLMTLR